MDGRLQYRSYDDKRGVQHNVTEIIVDNIEMLTPRNVTNNQVESKNIDATPAEDDSIASADAMWKEKVLLSQQDNVSPF